MPRSSTGVRRSRVRVSPGDDGRADQLVYLGAGREHRHAAGDDGGRVLLLGGEPFAEDDRHVVELHRPHPRGDRGVPEQWEHRDPRFPPVVNRAEQVMEAPTMPTVPLKPRPGGAGPVNPVDALREIGFLLERSRSDTHRVKAYRGAADIVAGSARSGPGSSRPTTGRRSPGSDPRPRW